MKKMIFIVSVLGLLWGCKKKNLEEIKPNDSNSTVNMYPKSILSTYKNSNKIEKTDFVFNDDKMVNAISYIDSSGNGSFQKIMEYIFAYDNDRITQSLFRGYAANYVERLDYYNTFTAEGKLKRFVRLEKNKNQSPYGDTTDFYYRDNELVYSINRFYTSFDQEVGFIPSSPRKDSAVYTKMSGSKIGYIKTSYDAHNGSIDSFYVENNQIVIGGTDIFQVYTKSKINDVLKAFNSRRYGNASELMYQFIGKSIIDKISIDFTQKYSNSGNPVIIQNEILTDSYSRVASIVYYTIANGTKMKIGQDTYIY